MKLPIEKWVYNSRLSITAKALLDESIICYKSGAYRAAFLFSYLSFLTLLKERILASNKPNLFPEGEWDLLMKKLQNEDTWESVVFDATQQQEKLDNNRVRTKDPVFAINDSLRQQIRFFKDRRNDCAHNKGNLISSSHVEIFWAFLESNYHKITVEGGMQSYLIKLKRHYDKSYTPKGKDVTPLVLEIENSIQPSELQNFWKQAFENIDTMYEFWIDNTIIEFVEKVFLLTNEILKKSLISFLKSNESFLFELISNNPKWFLLLEYNEQEIRNFWSTKICKIRNCLGIYACLLRNNLIPKGEIEEANELIFDQIKYYTDSVEDHLTLSNNGFGNTINRMTFEVGNFSKFMWVNNKVDLIFGYLSMYPFTKIAVENICIEYDKPNYYSFWLQERLERLFSNDLNKKSEFIQIAKSNNFKLPTNLPSLSN